MFLKARRPSSFDDGLQNLFVLRPSSQEQVGNNGNDYYGDGEYTAQRAEACVLKTCVIGPGQRHKRLGA